MLASNLALNVSLRNCFKIPNKTYIFQNDPELFKKLDNEIWEFRTKYNKSHYRIFAFWDKSDNKETLVIATHGILKKTDKTPIKEIAKAKSMMKQYFENKIKK